MLSHAHSELVGAEYVVFVNPSRRYVDCSDGVVQLLGYGRQELLQKSIEDISYHGPDEVKRLFKHYFNAGSLEGEWVLIRKDFTAVPIRYKSFVFSDGCLAAMWEPVHDWRELYIAALLEVDPTELRRKAEIALAAIQARTSQSNTSQTVQEGHSIRDAMWVLQDLLKRRE